MEEKTYPNLICPFLLTVIKSWVEWIIKVKLWIQEKAPLGNADGFAIDALEEWWFQLHSFWRSFRWQNNCAFRWKAVLLSDLYTSMSVFPGWIQKVRYFLFENGICVIFQLTAAHTKCFNLHLCISTCWRRYPIYKKLSTLCTRSHKLLRLPQDINYLFIYQHQSYSINSTVPLFCVSMLIIGLKTIRF